MDWFKKIKLLGNNDDQSNLSEIVNNQLEIEQDFLKKVTYDDIDYFHLKGLEKWAKVVRIYDADSPTLIFFVNGRPQKWRCRLARIDTAEKTSIDPAEVAHSLKAIERLTQLIDNKLIWIKISRMDKYQRPLIDMFPNPDTDFCFNDLLVGEGLAYEYNGGKRIPFRDWSLKMFSHGIPKPDNNTLQPVDNIQDLEIIHADETAEDKLNQTDFNSITNVEEVFK